MPRSSALLLLLLAFFIPAHAAVPSYSAIYVFGDSYCDVGNDYVESKGAVPPSPPYYNGRFSNGPLWIEHIAGALRLPMQPAVLGGTDYATGGAYVTQPYPTVYGTVPSVPEQVALFLLQHGGKADPNALYVIEGGGNDILGATGGSPSQLGYEIALGLAEAQLTLRQAGAKNFLIPNLLDVGQLPAAQANAAFASAATVAVNTDLGLALDIESYLPGVKITQVDEYTLFHAIAADATHFGFTDITHPCIVGKTVCADPDHTLFWDVEHPTEFGHAFFAVTVEQALTR